MTVSRYSVVRYVPDPLREEYINIGVVLTTDDGSFSDCRFLQNWKRPRDFAHRDVTFLKDVAADFGVRVNRQPQLLDSGATNSLSLHRLAEEWQNVVRLSTPRTSVASDPARLLDELYVQYVAPVQGRTNRGRDKRHAVRLARDELRQALAERDALEQVSISQNEVFHGQADFHEFGLIVRNGKPLAGVEALSFELPPSRDIDKDIESTAWAIRDVRDRYPEMLLSVVMLPPAGDRKDYVRARTVYEGMHARVATPDNLTEWAAETASKIPELSESIG